MTIALGLFFFFSLGARADVVVLANGAKMSGIVLETAPDGLNLQVDEEGFVILSTETVASVQRQTAAQNKALRAQWRVGRQKAETDEQRERTFAAAQRAKGLTFFQGEWITTKEYELRLAKQELDDKAHGKNAQAFVAAESTARVLVPPTATMGPANVFPYFFLAPSAAPAPERPRRVIVFSDGKIIRASDERVIKFGD
jgi:hypothetical protein